MLLLAESGAVLSGRLLDEVAAAEPGLLLLELPDMQERSPRCKF